MLKKKKIIIDLSALIVIVAGIIIANLMIITNRRKSYRLDGDSNIYAYQVEEVNTDQNDVIIKGWFFELNKVQNVEREIDGKTYSVLISKLDNNENTDDGDVRSGKGIIAELQNESRHDVNKFFCCEYDYSNCGFIAKIDKSLLDIENGSYLIIIKADKDSEHGIPAAYIENGELQYTNPSDKMNLNVEETDLEDIVKNGVCVVSCPKYHICVYQYGWKLYWIADEEYTFEEDGSTYIQYQIDTTQFDKLPVDRTVNGWYWSNIGANFEDYEITDEMNCGQYRVYMRDIPKEYSVVRIETGYYINDWVWSKNIRPDYRKFTG